VEVFGRLAAPTFFFLMGYAQTRTVPLHWIWLGIILILLDGWNANWTWVAPNILLSFALVRFARPYVQILIQAHGWAAFALLVSALVAVLPIAAKVVDNGAEGRLWALFGLSRSRGQRTQISIPGPFRRYSIAKTSAALGMIRNPPPEFTREEAVGFELSMLINDQRSAA
jgi:hypothetical protein